MAFSWVKAERCRLEGAVNAQLRFGGFHSIDDDVGAPSDRGSKLELSA